MPSMAVIMSPSCMPAASAGVFSPVKPVIFGIYSPYVISMITASTTARSIFINGPASTTIMRFHTGCALKHS